MRGTVARLDRRDRVAQANGKVFAAKYRVVIETGLADCRAQLRVQLTHIALAVLIALENGHGAL